MTIVEFLNARYDEAEAEWHRYRKNKNVFALPCPNCGKRILSQSVGGFDTDGVFLYHGNSADCFLPMAAWREFADDGPAGDPRVLADVEAKRAIIELHKQWPILIEGPSKFETDASGLDSVAFKMSRQIVWATEQEYRNRFGLEPPTTPMLRALASVYADHEDYQQEWAVQPSLRSTS